MKMTLLTLSAVMFVVGFAQKSLSSPVFEKLCSQKFHDPKVTSTNFGTFYVCTLVPAAHITDDAAKEAALLQNMNFAKSHCGAVVYALAHPDVLMVRNHVATAISLFVCR